MNASSAHRPAAGMPNSSNPIPSNTATIPPNTVATPKYRRVPCANLPTAPRTGSWPAFTRFILAPNNAPSSPMKITSTSTNSNADSAEVTEPSTPSTAEMIELELMLLVIDWMSDWLIPKPASQVSKLVISCWICVEYSGSRVASWATPMTSPKISPSRIAKMTMTKVRLASQRGAPFLIIQPRIGFTVTVSTTARKIGARMPGTWWIPAATTTAAAKPRMMIKPRGRPDVTRPESGDGGSDFREFSAAAGSCVLGGVWEAGSAGLSVMLLSSVLGVLPLPLGRGHRRPGGNLRAVAVRFGGPRLVGRPRNGRAPVWFGFRRRLGFGSGRRWRWYELHDNGSGEQVGCARLVRQGREEPAGLVIAVDRRVGWKAAPGVGAAITRPNLRD